MSSPSYNQHGAEATAESLATVSLLIVEIGGERYGLPATSVREVLRHRAWTIVPGAPPTLPGIISQRGMILPIVELRSLLGLPETELRRSARLVLAQHAEIDMALLVEAVFDLATLPETAFVAPPGTLESRRGRFINGIADFEGQPLAMLDLDVLIGALREGG